MRFAVLLLTLGLVASGTAAEAGGKTRRKAPSRHHPVSHTSHARRNAQQKPTQERYQQIQQALADRGYYSGTVNGNWGDDSVSALKRFQADQNLDPDGKLSPLSLIALGLGPKRSEPPAHSPSTPPATSAAPEPTQSQPTPASQEQAGAH